MNVSFTCYWIDSYHDLVPERMLRVVGRAIASCLLRATERVVAINDSLASFRVQLGISRNRTFVVPAGVVTERFNPHVSGQPLKTILGLESADRFLFSRVSMYEFSGFVEVVRALTNLNEPQRIRMLLVGKGEARPQLDQLASSPAAHERTFFVDRVLYQDLPQYVAAADICILPAKLNGVMRHVAPIRLCEYMACGKSVIVTKIPGVTREFGRDNGVIHAAGPTDIDRIVQNPHYRIHSLLKCMLRFVSQRPIDDVRREQQDGWVLGRADCCRQIDQKKKCTGLENVSIETVTSCERAHA